MTPSGSGAPGQWEFFIHNAAQALSKWMRAGAVYRDRAGKSSLLGPARVGFVFRLFVLTEVQLIYVASLVDHGSNGKESACNVQDLGLLPGSGRSPGEGNGYSLQCSCLENSLDRGAW